MKTELLSPAGDIEAGYAALYYGADAVYLGLQKFSARATATNFDAETLADFTGYAHSLNRKVYVTINTILQTKELPDLLETLDACVAAHIDAVIVQDLGVARVIKQSYPDLALHASTQMAVHNLQGALALKKLGFERVVLARELTFNEIKDIKEKAGVEVEVFVHGALCYSYSGLCLFSSLTTGKSANRGKCLYPCRECFLTETGEKMHLFSMKDLALGEDVLKLPGVSLKIEGRKKNALYVAAVTDYYRSILDGKGADSAKEERLKQIFARPWTKLHFNGKNKDVIDKDFVGHRGLPIGHVISVVKGVLTIKPTHTIERYDGIQIDVKGQEKPYGFSLEKMKVQGHPTFKAEEGQRVEIILPPKAPFIHQGDTVYLASSTSVKGAYPYEKPKPGLYKPKYPINVEVKISSQKIAAISQGQEVSLDVALNEKALYAEKVEQAIRKAFDKTGETLFSINQLHVHNPENLFVPASLLNEIRRTLYARIQIEQKKSYLPSIEKIEHLQQPQYIIKTDNIASSSLLDLSKFAEIIIVLSKEIKEKDLKVFPKNKIRLSLPAVCRNVEPFKEIISTFLALGYHKWEIGHFWGLELLPQKGIDLSFDNSIYMMNPQAIQMAKEMGARRVTLSPEDTLENMKDLASYSPLPIVLPAYTDPVLFISANCIRENPCSSCDRQRKQWDIQLKGKTYQVVSQNCQASVYADKALCMIKEAQEIHPDFIRIDFVGKTYTAEEVQKIIGMTLFSQPIEDVWNANLMREI